MYQPTRILIIILFVNLMLPASLLQLVGESLSGIKREQDDVGNVKSVVDYFEELGRNQSVDERKFSFESNIDTHIQDSELHNKNNSHEIIKQEKIDETFNEYQMELKDLQGALDKERAKNKILIRQLQEVLANKRNCEISNEKYEEQNKMKDKELKSLQLELTKTTQTNDDIIKSLFEEFSSSVAKVDSTLKEREIELALLKTELKERETNSLTELKECKANSSQPTFKHQHGCQLVKVEHRLRKCKSEKVLAAEAFTEKINIKNDIIAKLERELKEAKEMADEEDDSWIDTMEPPGFHALGWM